MDMPTNLDSWSEVATVAEQAALEVGDLIASYISENRVANIHFKGEIDIATDMDLWSEKTIRERVSSRFPNDLIIGEESVTELLKSKKLSIKEIVNSSPRAWIIDPIDGTNNFSNHLPQVAISIGFLEYGVPKVGIAYDPVRREMFRAIKGQGATLNGIKITPSTKTRIIDSIVGISFPVDRESKWEYYWSSLEPVVLNCRTARVLGSGVLNLCWVACGRLDGVVEHNLKIWDLAAAILVAKEAGCTIANSDTNELSEKELPIDLFKRCLVISGPQLFDNLYKIVSDSRTSA